MAIAPIRIKVLNLRSTPLSQLPKRCATLRGGYKVEPIWVIDHIDLANCHSKKRWLIVSSWRQKTHLLLPCQLRLTRLSLVRITPLRRYQAKTFVFNGIFIDQIFVFLKTGVSDWINALYIESTENLPVSFRFHRTTSDPCNNWTLSSRWLGNTVLGSTVWLGNPMLFLLSI
jgi:hypothetical protein